MAIQYVGRRSATKVGATSGTSSIALNTGIVGGSRGFVEEGDLVIAIFATGSTADRSLSITDGSSDYDLIGSELYTNGNYDTNLRVACKFMGSTPDTAVTFGPSGNVNDCAATAYMVFSGVDPTTPFDVTVQTSLLTNSILANPPSITPDTAGAFIVCIGAGCVPGIAFADYGASGLTDFFATRLTGVNSILFGAGHKADWSSGAYDQSAFTYSPGDSSVYSSAAMTIALRPDPSVSSGGNVKVWNGSSWVAKPVKVWNGSSWVTKPVKRWNGSAWVTTTY